jgi:hypothetical protein
LVSRARAFSLGGNACVCARAGGRTHAQRCGSAAAFLRAPPRALRVRACARVRFGRGGTVRFGLERRDVRFLTFSAFSVFWSAFSVFCALLVCVCVCACACAFLRAALKNASIAHAHLCVRVFCARPFCARCASKTQIWPPRNAARKRRRRGAPRPHTHSPAQPGALRGAQATFSPKAQKWPAKLASGT